MPLIRKASGQASISVDSGNAFAILANGTQDERRRAARPVANLPGGIETLGAVRPTLPDLLNDADADVRLSSCEIVRGLPSDLATSLLCDLLGLEAAVNVCAAAVDVLAEVGGAQAVPALRHCADRFPHELFLVFAIRIAIQRVGNQAGSLRG